MSFQALAGPQKYRYKRRKFNFLIPVENPEIESAELHFLNIIYPVFCNNVHLSIQNSELNLSATIKFKDVDGTDVTFWFHDGPYQIRQSTNDHRIIFRGNTLTIINGMCESWGDEYSVGTAKLILKLTPKGVYGVKAILENLPA